MLAGRAMVVGMPRDRLCDYRGPSPGGLGYPLLTTQRATVCAVRFQAAVRGRRLRAWLSGLAAMSSGRAGAIYGMTLFDAIVF